MFFSTTYSSPVGVLTLASDGENLIGLWIAGQKYHGENIFQMTENNDLPVFAIIKQWLDKYFAGQNPAPCKLPLAPIGSEFRHKVWTALRRIPYGKVITYGEIARRLGIKYARAIGGAVGRNPVSIIIPCHRVVGSNRSLTGYAGGLAVKTKLLGLEGVDTSIFSI
jgi:methylated-DNA-[protein]-cysteine S-methyltransferase